jgi:hypothetical protein
MVDPAQEAAVPHAAGTGDDRSTGDTHTGVPPRLDVGARPAVEVADWLRGRLRDHGTAELLVPDPDEGTDGWPGEPRPDGSPRLDLRAWLDLADAVGARLRTPRPHRPRPDAGHAPARLRLRFERRSGEAELHADGGRAPGRYAADGDFARVRKMALPGFVLPLLDALAFAAPRPPERVLVAGCHRGDELEALARATPPVPPERVTGVDRQADALDEARRRHPRARFLDADLAALPGELGRFDLIVAIGVLQSPELDGPALLRSLVRDHATAAGGLVVGLPCSRFVGGEVVWGARTRNHAEIDLSLVVRDLAGHRRYLHQQGYRTRIGGRYDLLLTARREG